MRNRRPEVIIVGAGPGGLASAILLGSAGFSVRVLERHGRVGGRTSSIVSDGFRFDVGPTFFLYPRILQEIYRAAGRDLMSEVPMTRLDPQYKLIFGSGGELEATPRIDAMEEAIAKLCPGDKHRFRAFLEDNREKLERFRPCLESSFDSWKDVLSPSMMRLLPLLKPWKSLDQELASYFCDPRLRLAFSFQSKYLGMSPFRCPSLFSILSFLEYESGVWHPEGGCSAVTANMAKVAEDVGVRIHLNEPVREILFEGKRAVGARTDRGSYRCDAMMINADFAQAMTKLVPDRLRTRWTDRNIGKKKFSCSTYMMYLGLQGRYDNVAHHTIYISKDYQRNLEEIETKHVLSDDPSFYVQNASVTDNTLAPPGMSTLYVLIPVTHKHPNVDWNRESARYRAVAIEQLKKLGIEDIERRIRFERIVTPDEWESQFDIYRGATFNLAHTLTQMLHLRPHNRFEDLEGVYLTGGGTHPGSGLPVIFESARISSRLLIQDFGGELPAGLHEGESAIAVSRVA